MLSTVPFKCLGCLQIDELRKQIQATCQSINPLGKCIGTGGAAAESSILNVLSQSVALANMCTDFIYEDMDQMTRELSMWKRAYAEHSEQLSEEQR